MSGVPKADGEVESPKMRWLPLLDTLVRLGQFSGKHLQLKNLLLDFPDTGDSFTQRGDEYVKKRTQVRSWPKSQGLTVAGHHTDAMGSSKVELHWMHQRMWLRSALTAPKRAPAFAKAVNMDALRPQTKEFTDYWDPPTAPPSSEPPSDEAKNGHLEDLATALKSAPGTALSREPDDWDLSLRWKIGLSLKSFICLLLS